MAAVLATDTVRTAPVDAPPVDRQLWWAGVQLDVSAMLTEAAHPAATRRRAG